MPRLRRSALAGYCYHVVCRANRRETIFHGRADYRDALTLMARAQERRHLRLLGFCLMPNHMHLVVWPENTNDMSRWMQWFLAVQTQRHNLRHGTVGHLWQGRFKSFPIQQDGHLLTVLRYVERNALRADLVGRAEDWPWSSLASRHSGHASDLLTEPPVPLSADWTAWVNAPQTPAELEAIRSSVARGSPFGRANWVARTARDLSLEQTLRPRGRPPKEEG